MADSEEPDLRVHRAIADLSEAFLDTLLEWGPSEIEALGSGLLEVDLQDRLYRHNGKPVSLPRRIAEDLFDRLSSTLKGADVDPDLVSSATIRADLTVDSRPLELNHETARAAVTHFICRTEARIKIADVAFKGVHSDQASRLRPG